MLNYPQTFLVNLFSVWQILYLSICPSVCPCVRVFTFEVPLKCLFAPTSWSQMSNFWRDSESLGKSNGNRWSQIWTFLFGSGQKLKKKKKQKKNWFFLTKHGGNHASCWIRRPLVEECITNYGIFLDVFEILRFEFLHFEWFFSIKKKNVFWVFLVHLETTLPDGFETSGQRAYR